MNQQGLLLAAHDISEGGLAVALAEMTVTCGAVISMNTDDKLKALFGERLGRIIVSAARDNAEKIEKLAQTAGISCHSIGESSGNSLKITINGSNCLELPLERYRPVYEQTIRTVMDSGSED
jgi:phosphoribosylformylglycinamidine synthase